MKIGAYKGYKSVGYGDVANLYCEVGMTPENANYADVFIANW